MNDVPTDPVNEPKTGPEADATDPGPVPDPASTGSAAGPPADPAVVPPGEPPSGVPIDPPVSPRHATEEIPPHAPEDAPSTPPTVPEGLHQGRVLRLTAEQVILELPDGRSGAVPLVEFAGQPMPAIGASLQVIIQPADPVGDLLALSKRDAETLTFWESIKPGDLIEGVVTGMNKGGLDVDLGGARAFLPASHADTQPMKDISILIGEHVKCVVTLVDPTARDLIVSRRNYLRGQNKRKRKELFDGLVEGETRTGKVASIADYGAFVDIGGANGLLHTSDMSWGRIKHPSQVVQQGQELEVKILDVDRKKGRISLGLKQLQPDPWDAVAQRYPEQTKVTGRVLNLTDFGAFLELEDGVEALLPLSEMSWSKRIGRSSDFVKKGDTPEVVVLQVDPDRRRISVGLKQLEENPWADVETRFPVNETFKGKVSKIAEFGAFVELATDVEGLVHISELTDHRVRSVGDVVTEGNQVEVRVLKIDTAAQRISLSMRPAPEAGAEPTDAGKPKKKRKKPLRGGLASHFEWGSEDSPIGKLNL